MIRAHQSHRVILSAGMVVVMLAAGSAAFAGAWSGPFTIEHGGLTRYFRIYTPDVLSPAHPLIFRLHGGEGSMFVDGGARLELEEIADEFGVLVLAPNGVAEPGRDPAGEEQHWNDCREDILIPFTTEDDVGFIARLLDWALVRYDIDPERVYATGGSNGGMMSFRLARELDDRIAAVAAFIANEPTGDECTLPSRPVPVFIANGTEDPLMPWGGGCIGDFALCSRGSVISAAATREAWIARNGTSLTPSESIAYPDLDPRDGCTATSDLYVDGGESSEVVFYEVLAGGHYIPTIDHPTNDALVQLRGNGNENNDIEGLREAWDFLERHRLNGPRRTGADLGVATELRVLRGIDDDLVLWWYPDCGGGASYGIYRGDLRAGLASMAPVAESCALSSTRASIPLGEASAEFFLVVPNDGALEGSYGVSSDGALRAPASMACHPPGQLDACAY